MLKIVALVGGVFTIFALIAGSQLTVRYLKENRDQNFVTV